MNIFGTLKTVQRQKTLSCTLTMQVNFQLPEENEQSTQQTMYLTFLSDLSTPQKQKKIRSIRDRKQRMFWKERYNFFKGGVNEKAQIKKKKSQELPTPLKTLSFCPGELCSSITKVRTVFSMSYKGQRETNRTSCHRHKVIYVLCN